MRQYNSINSQGGLELKGKINLVIYVGKCLRIFPLREFKIGTKQKHE